MRQKSFKPFVQKTTMCTMVPRYSTGTRMQINTVCHQDKQLTTHVIHENKVENRHDCVLVCRFLDNQSYLTPLHTLVERIHGQQQPACNMYRKRTQVYGVRTSCAYYRAQESVKSRRKMREMEHKNVQSPRVPFIQEESECAQSTRAMRKRKYPSLHNLHVTYIQE